LDSAINTQQYIIIFPPHFEICCYPTLYNTKYMDVACPLAEFISQLRTEHNIEA